MAQKKILIVEDGEFNRDLLVQLLGDEYEVLVAVDGEEGIRKARQERPDLILMDLGLPGLDGWGATRIIKANGELKHIPVIAVTSHAMVGDERRAREAGCNDYLSKPIDEEELLEKIRKLIYT
jgi:two-component system, cell cycle response regulator DivK